jgi:hypothetical protein
MDTSILLWAADLLPQNGAWWISLLFIRASSRYGALAGEV